MTTYTTLNKIKEHSPCTDGYEQLLKFLGKTKSDDEPLDIITIAESNGVNDAIWCLISLPKDDKIKIVLFACDCAESVLHIFENKYPHDDIPRKAIQAARDYNEGKISKKELEKATANATNAAYDAYDAYATNATNAANAAYYAASAANAAYYAASAANAAYAANASYATNAANAANAAYYAADAAEREKQLQFLIKHFG